MTLQEFIDGLPKYKQFALAIELVNMALPIWDKYASANKLMYNDTVAGMRHSVDKNLLRKTVDAIELVFKAHEDNMVRLTDKNLILLSMDFCEPIAALQDMDWKLPYEMECIFYAVYNLLRAAMGEEKTVFGETTIYVVNNQAIDALVCSNIMTLDQLKPIVYKYKAHV